MPKSNTTTSGTHAAASADEPPSRQSTLEITIASGLSAALNLHWLRTHLDAAMTMISDQTCRPFASVQIMLVADDQMVELHRQHLDQSTTTDVLSFDFSGSRFSPIEAELVVCVDEAARHATRFNHTIEQELLLYCVHGILHCAGHDDLTDAGYQAMHAEEDRILTAIGVGATFTPHHVGDRKRKHS